jgi:glycosyltransferase involved in cell wall biosynthesis
MAFDFDAFYQGGARYRALEAERDDLLGVKHWLYEQWQARERDLREIHSSRMWRVWMLYHAIRRPIASVLSPILRPGRTVRRLRLSLRRSFLHARIAASATGERIRASITRPLSPLAVSPRVTGATGFRPRVLIVSAYPVYPPTHGGAVRLFNLIKQLGRQTDLSIIVFSRNVDDNEEREALAPHCRSVEFHRWTPSFDNDPLNSTPRSFQLFWSEEFRKLFLEVIERDAIQVVQLEYTELGQYVSVVPEDIPVILSEYDISFRTHGRRMKLGFAERYPESQNFCASAHDIRRILLHELDACRRADSVHVMSAEDGTYLSRFLGKRASTLRVVPNGVDCDVFAPPADQTRNGRVLFVGNFQNLPNQDGLEFMVSDIWPTVRAACPGAALTVVGSNADERTAALAGSDGVELVGRVPDVVPYYQEHSVMVAPIRAGSGTRLKILEAFAAGIPVVSTTTGVEGIEAEHGVHLVITDDPGEFARAIITLLQDRARAETLADRAQELVRERYDWHGIASVIVDSYAELLASAPLAARRPAPALHDETAAGQPSNRKPSSPRARSTAPSPDYDLEAHRPTITHPFAGTPIRDTDRVLVVGVYLADQENTVADAIRTFGESEDWDVDQRWLALGAEPADPHLARHTTGVVLQRTPKSELLNRLFKAEDLTRYEFVVICDDDVVLPKGFVDSFLGYQSTLGYRICQPARTARSYVDIPIVTQHPGVVARRTRFVEQGPVVSFHQTALDIVVPFDLTSPMGWGLEYVWAHEAEHRELPLGIIDATPVEHSLRPPVEHYSRSAAEEGRARLLAANPHLEPTESYTVVDVVPIPEGTR